MEEMRSVEDIRSHRIWNTSFGFLISSSSVEWTVFRDILSLPIPSKLGGEKIKQVFLTSCILLAIKLLFREYFAEGLTPPWNNLLSWYLEEETLLLLINHFLKTNFKFGFHGRIFLEDCKITRIFELHRNIQTRHVKGDQLNERLIVLRWFLMKPLLYLTFLIFFR